MGKSERSINNQGLKIPKWRIDGWSTHFPWCSSPKQEEQKTSRKFSICPSSRRTQSVDQPAKRIEGSKHKEKEKKNTMQCKKS